MTITSHNPTKNIGISIHTALAGCDNNGIDDSEEEEISIHTALAGCDGGDTYGNKELLISIHTALAGCDAGFTDQSFSDMIFQSTQPSQAVTIIDVGDSNIP